MRLLPVVRRRSRLLLPLQTVCKRHPPQHWPHWSTSKLSAGSTSIARQSSMHACCSRVQGNSTSLLTWSVLPKEPISIQSCTPVIWAISLCLHDPNEIRALQLHTDLYSSMTFLLFPPPCCIREQLIFQQEISEYPPPKGKKWRHLEFLINF